MTVASPPTPVDLPPVGTRCPWSQIGLLLFLSSLCLNALGRLCLLLNGAVPELFEVLGPLLCVTGLLTWLIAVLRNQALRRRGERISPNDRLRMANWSLFAGLVLLTLLALLLPARRAAQAHSQTAAHQAYLADRPGSWQRVSTPDGLVAIDLPQGWGPSGIIDLGQTGVARFDPTNTLGVLVRSEPKANLTITRLEQYSELLIGGLSRDLEQVKVVRHTASVNPHLSIESELTWSDGPTRLVMLLHVRDTPQHFVQIRAWSTPTELRNHADLLRKIIDSVQIETVK